MPCHVLSTSSSHPLYYMCHLDWSAFVILFIHLYMWWTIFRCRRHVPFQRWLLISIATISFNRWFFIFIFPFAPFRLCFWYIFCSRYCRCWYCCAVPCASIHKFTWCFVMFGAFICLFIFNFYCEKQYKLRQKMGTKKESC